MGGLWRPGQLPRTSAEARHGDSSPPEPAIAREQTSLAAATSSLAGVLGRQIYGSKNGVTAWPVLGGRDNDVDSFKEGFEQLLGLANEGGIMNATEMVRCIGQCPRGSRRQACQVEVRAARHGGRLKADPEGTCQRILPRLHEFRESLMEKQHRLNAERSNLARGRRSALEPLPVFEHRVADMETSGPVKSDRGPRTGYLALSPQPPERAREGPPRLYGGERHLGTSPIRGAPGEKRTACW